MSLDSGCGRIRAPPQTGILGRRYHLLTKEKVNIEKQTVNIKNRSEETQNFYYLIFAFFKILKYKQMRFHTLQTDMIKSL
jgi:hypothetical protein